jgi:hypothetical protein
MIRHGYAPLAITPDPIPMPAENSSQSRTVAAQVTVSRDSPDDVQTRQIFVLLDGERKAELLFGDEISFPVPEGRHTIRVDNTWNHKDLILDINAGDDLHFLTKSVAGQFSRFLLVALGAGPIYVSIEPAAPRQPS